MTENISVKLSRPIMHHGQEVAELTFREANVGDMIAADEVQGDFAKTAAMLASMAGVDIDTFKQLPLRDLNKITKATNGFLGNDDTPGGQWLRVAVLLSHHCSTSISEVEQLPIRKAARWHNELSKMLSGGRRGETRK
ncbi:Phage tail assembly chaperone protein, E, or 41 or 14 [Devosia crocina]|uniref:Phage tail assembly chaperone protein, E, or 41 or 14 n=1 Tax=Devosia crocina TaxID=429728 RepID=A0A1I7ND34_9HYPH|nr:phage tail assembly protein [Devosia crocina]SFV32570.1 Phage tail assembly chaperone protein, E, or 41 or 14 [Devosia crocina]